MARPSARRQIQRDPDETVDIEVLLNEAVPNADVWRQIPNPVLGGRRPDDFIGQPDEHILCDLLRAAKQGAFS